MVLVILAALAALTAALSFLGQKRFGPLGWSPTAALLLILGILWFTGRFHIAG